MCYIISSFHCVKSVQTQSFFWSVFSRIRTEYGEILRISPYSVRMWENTGQKKLRIRTLFTQCFIQPLHFNFTNIKYLCLYFWVICANNSIIVANVGQTKIYFWIYEPLKMRYCFFLCILKFPILYLAQKLPTLG